MKRKRSFRDHVGGSYLTKEDFPKPESLTISQVREEEVTAPGKEPNTKDVVYFEEIQKGLVLNKTNGEFLEALTGSDNPDDWVGTRVELFNNATVRGPDGSKGGIRVRSPKPHRPVGINEPTSGDFDEDAMNAELEAAASK